MFFLDLLARALRASIYGIGQSKESLVFAALVLVVSLLWRAYRLGAADMRTEALKVFGEGLGFAAIIWLCYFLWQFGYAIPRDITEAASALPPPPISRGAATQSPPSFWRGTGEKGAAAKADLEVEFRGIRNLLYIPKNNSQLTAEHPRYSFALVNYTHPYRQPLPGVWLVPLPIATRGSRDDFVRPRDALGATPVLDSASQSAVQPGDVLYGWCGVTCVNCERRRVYLIYWIAGSGGWYAEKTTKGSIQMPLMNGRPSLTKAEIDAAIGYTVPVAQRKVLK